MSVPAPAWVVAGPPGAGKSTVAGLLLAALEPTPALLDKDTMYGSFVAAVLASAGRPPGEREGPWYDEHVKIHEYAGMTATRPRNPRLRLPGPAVRPLYRADPRRSAVAVLGRRTRRRDRAPGLGQVRRGHLAPPASARGLARDSAKLAEFGQFCASMRLGTAPAAPHVTVDNRLTAAASLDDQIAALIRQA